MSCEIQNICPDLQYLSSRFLRPVTVGTYILPQLMPPVYPPPTSSLLWAHRFSSPSQGAQCYTERKLPFHFLFCWWEQFVLRLSPRLFRTDWTKRTELLPSWPRAWCIKSVRNLVLSLTLCVINIIYHDSSHERVVLGKYVQLENNSLITLVAWLSFQKPTQYWSWRSELLRLMEVVDVPENHFLCKVNSKWMTSNTFQSITG